jgi:hypothetical protein
VAVAAAPADERIRAFLTDLERYLEGRPADAPRRTRVNRQALAAFLLLGVPSALMLLLSFLAYWGVVVEPLRALWRPEPSEDVKWLVGGIVLFVTLFDLLRGS